MEEPRLSFQNYAFNTEYFLNLSKICSQKMFKNLYFSFYSLFLLIILHYPCYINNFFLKTAIVGIFAYSFPILTFPKKSGRKGLMHGMPSTNS
jgi:hypothetical protein